MVIFNPVHKAKKFYQENVLGTVFYTVDVLLKVGVVFLILATFFVSSVFLYIAFYNANVPSVIHVHPVYLQYEPCKGTYNAAKGKEEPCNFPMAHIQLTKDSQLLMSGQQYKISISLEMPESPANKETGMFMVCGQMITKNSVTVAHSCRSASLRYKSSLVHFLSTFSFAPLLIFGSMEEKQYQHIELFDAFEDDPSFPVTDVFIEIKSYQVEVYSSKLEISAQMSGLRYLMYNWRMTSAVVGIAYIFVFLTFIASLSLWQVYGPDQQPDILPPVEDVPWENEDDEEGKEYIYKGIRRLTPFSLSFKKFRKQHSLDDVSEEESPSSEKAKSDIGEPSSEREIASEGKYVTEYVSLGSSSDA